MLGQPGLFSGDRRILLTVPSRCRFFQRLSPSLLFPPEFIHRFFSYGSTTPPPHRPA
ncbi:MAG: hypothetical protein HC824_16460 [Synechococcales cyanobacterium RM1_1_8]|nr:hypothetical protein [Synechococcales cyanobacterium RM1_1_8]